MESTHLSNAPTDLDAQRPSAGVATFDAREEVTEPGGSLVGSALGGAPGQPPGEGMTHLLRSPALAGSANDGLRAVAIQRAQRTHGNRYVQRLVAGLGRSPSRSIQRQCACGGTCAKCQAEAAGQAPEAEHAEEEPKLVQAQSSDGAGGSAPALPADEVIPHGQGDPLDEETRRHMESRFGTNFGGVRVHTDGHAADSARAIQADAFTTGRDIYFASGKYAPEQSEGQHLLAHELAHTVQQSGGDAPREPAARRDDAVVIGHPDDPMEQGAERAADMAVDSAQATVVPAPLALKGAGAPSTVRRQPTDTSDKRPPAQASPPTQAPAPTPDSIPAPTVPPPAPLAQQPAQPDATPAKAPDAPANPTRTAGPDAPATAKAPTPVSTPDAPASTRASAPAQAASPAPDARGATPADAGKPGAVPTPTAAGKDRADPAKAGGVPPASALARSHVDTATANEALARFQEQADTQRSALFAAADAEKRKVFDASAELKTNVQSGVDSEAARLDVLYQDAIDRVGEAAGRIRGDILTVRDDKIQSIEATAKTNSETLTRTVREKQAALGSGAEEKAKAALKFGEEQAKRATDASRKKATEATEIGARKVTQYQGYDRAARIARVIKEMAADGNATLIKSGDELAGVARSDAGDLADKFRKEAREASGQYDDALDDGLEKISKEREAAIAGLMQAAEDPITQIDEDSRNIIEQLGATRAEAVAQVRQLAVGILTGIDTSTQAAAVRIEAEVTAAVRELDASVDTVSQRLGKTRGRVAEAKLKEGEAVLASSCAEFQTVLAGLSGDMLRELSGGTTGALRRVADQVDRFGDPIQKVVIEFQAGVEKTYGEVAASMEKLAGQSLQGMDDAVSEVDTELQKGLDQDLKEWDDELSQGTAQIRDKVDQGVATFDEIVTKLGDEIDDKANEIEDESWYSRALSWIGGVFVGILEGVWEAIKGILLIVLIVLAVVAAIALLIVLLIALGASLEVILAVLAVVATIAEIALAVGEVVAAVLIVYGVITGIASIIEGISRDDLSDYERGKLGGKGAFDVTFSIFGEEILSAVGGWARGLVGLEEAGAEGKALGKAADRAAGETPVEPTKPGEVPKPDEAPKDPALDKSPEPNEPVADDTAKRAEENGVPREKLQAEVNELRQKATNPDNVRDPKDPHFDAEMDADGHTFDRNKSDRSWCRASSDPFCDLDLGGELNNEVDAANAKRAAAPKGPAGPATLESIQKLDSMQNLLGKMSEHDVTFNDLGFKSKESLIDFLKNDPEAGIAKLNASLDKTLDIRGVRAAEELKAPLESKLDFENVPKGQTPETLEAGNAFNAARASEYPYNEVYVDRPGGTRVRLDSYNPTAGEIVSRKFTQLADLPTADALGYVSELPTKYPPGATISDVPSNVSNGLVGQQLQGQMILEVPVQTRAIPQQVIDAANRAGVTIRDVNNTVYNP